MALFTSLPALLKIKFFSKPPAVRRIMRSKGTSRVCLLVVKHKRETRVYVGSPVSLFAQHGPGLLCRRKSPFEV